MLLKMQEWKIHKIRVYICKSDYDEVAGILSMATASGVTQTNIAWHINPKKASERYHCKRQSKPA